MKRRKTSTKTIIRRLVLKRRIITLALFVIFVISAIASPAAHVALPNKLMVDHKIIVPPEGILLSNGARIGGGQ